MRQDKLITLKFRKVKGIPDSLGGCMICGAKHTGRHWYEYDFASIYILLCDNVECIELIDVRK
jgi:hypothetical protein